jgi:hypothetical protein
MITGNSAVGTIDTLWLSGSSVRLAHTLASSGGPVPNGIRIFGGNTEGGSLRVSSTNTFSIQSHLNSNTAAPLVLSGSTVSINAHTSNVSNGVVIQGGPGATNLARFWGSTSNVNIDLGGTTSTVFSAPLSTSPNAEITLTGSNINFSHGGENGKGATFQRGGTKYGSIQYTTDGPSTYAQFGNEVPGPSLGAANVRIGSTGKVNLSGSIVEVSAGAGAVFTTTTAAATNYLTIASGSFPLAGTSVASVSKIESTLNSTNLLLGAPGIVFLTGSQARISVGGTNTAALQRDGRSFITFSSGSTSQNETTVSTVLSTRVDLFNTVATTVNFAGAATALEIGASTGTTSINNNLTVDGNTTLGNAATDTTTVAGSLAVNGTPGDGTNKITSTQTSFDLLNTTVTTLNIGGAATTLELGATSGTTSINNDLAVDGNTTLGSASTDTITFTARAASNLEPTTDSLYDLGSVGRRWKNIYTGDLHLRNDRGNWTIIEEREFLSITNNITGKRYKFVLQEIE